MPPDNSSQAMQRRSVLKRFVEDDFIERASFSEYREKVRDVYDGPKGQILSTLSLLSLHVALGERLIRNRVFELRGAKRVLDVGSGAGQLLQHVLRYSDSDAQIIGFDLSNEMLRRACARLKSSRPKLLVAGLPKLPFATGSFDCVTCGYVLEHLPDARMGLVELARVMKPGARMLLLTSEDTFSGAWTSRFFCCRTYNRRELRETCHELGIRWVRELWFSKVHELLHAGGICVELQKQ